VRQLYGRAVQQPSTRDAGSRDAGRCLQRRLQHRPCAQCFRARSRNDAGNHNPRVEGSSPSSGMATVRRINSRRCPVLVQRGRERLGALRPVELPSSELEGFGIDACAARQHALAAAIRGVNFILSATPFIDPCNRTVSPKNEVEDVAISGDVFNRFRRRSSGPHRWPRRKSVENPAGAGPGISVLRRQLQKRVAGPDTLEDVACAQSQRGILSRRIEPQQQRRQELLFACT
jgi:hypothetical protein